jgi:hypothetical protein
MSERSETSWCCGCKASKTWKGSGQRVHCTGCGTAFPCAHACAHWDCREEKGLAKADSNGVLKLVAVEEILALGDQRRAPRLVEENEGAGEGGEAGPDVCAPSATKGTSLMLPLVLALVGCASGLHEGPTALGPKESHALAHVPASPGGFEHFWVRPETELGAIRWSDNSKAVPAAPSSLLGLAQEKIDHRLNLTARQGLATDLTVTFFAWETGLFGRSKPEVGVEVIGRGDDGRILWMGVDRFQLSRSEQDDFSDGEGAADEFVRRLQRELRRARPAQSFGGT